MALKEQPIKQLIRLALLVATLAILTKPAPVNKQLAEQVPSEAPAQSLEKAQANPVKTEAKEIKRKPTPKQPERPVAAKEPKQVHPSGCENYRNLVSQYDWNADVALNVMRAESGCNPNAVGDGHLTYFQNGIEYGMSCGMFQVRFLPGRPSCSQMQTPAENIAYAYGLYKANGWQPWTVCNAGIVNCL